MLGHKPRMVGLLKAEKLSVQESSLELVDVQLQIEWLIHKIGICMLPPSDSQTKLNELWYEKVKNKLVLQKSNR